jgi:hypothetical protein
MDSVVTLVRSTLSSPYPVSLISFLSLLGSILLLFCFIGYLSMCANPQMGMTIFHIGTKLLGWLCMVQCFT